MTLPPPRSTLFPYTTLFRSLIFKLEEGVKWHDGKPFTAKDVVCTFDLLTGTGEQKLRRNPRRSWYGNVDRVEAKGDQDRKSTRLNSSHLGISYAVFCLKKKK